MRVTVIPCDQTIIVDGAVLRFEFAAEENIHAIQWHGDHGTVEKKIGAGEWFDDVSIVQPFVDAFNAEKRLLAEAVKPTDKATT
jgi:hypothetical protein